MGGTKRTNPTPEEVTRWLKQLEPHTLQDTAWLKIIRRFPGLTDALQPYIQRHFTNDNEQRAVYDGLILALYTIAHFEDIERLSELFTESSIEETADQLVLPDTDTSAA